MIWGEYFREVAISFFPATKRVRGNKIDPLNYLGHPIPLFGGEFIKIRNRVYLFRTRIQSWRLGTHRPSSVYTGKQASEDFQADFVGSFLMICLYKLYCNVLYTLF